MKSAHVFHRHTKADLPVAVRGDGAYILDADGKRYLDASGGAAVSCLGHSDKTVVDAIKAQLDALPYAHTGFFTTEAVETLADKLVEHAPDGIDRVYFLSGGSEAVEAALKLARQYFLETGQPERRHVIARWQSYHGNTLGALSAGGNRWRRSQFEPMLTGAMHHVSPCHAWRWKEADETDGQYADRLAQELDDKINDLGPETVAAFVCEPVVGATMGAVPGVEGYLGKIKAVCERHGVLMILDEVMCGMGRTGWLYACLEDGVQPDMIAIAKGLGAGYQPIGALLVSGRIFKAVEAGSGFFQHGHTYMGHPTACAAANAVLDRMIGDDLLSNVRARGEELRNALKGRFGNHPNIGDIRGRGLFLGMEIVADRGTKEPFDPALGINKAIKKRAMDEGLMCYPMGGTVDGQRGDHILLAPPFILTSDQVGEITDRLERAMAPVLEEARAA